MFPKAVRDRLMADQEETKADEKHFGLPFMGTQKSNALGDNPSAPVVLRTKPIADYYPSATILVTDLVGFTAWSSEREPAQVFTLLET